MFILKATTKGLLLTMLMLLTLSTVTLVLSSFKEVHWVHLEYVGRPVASELIPSTRVKASRNLKEDRVIATEKTTQEQSKAFDANQPYFTLPLS